MPTSDYLRRVTIAKPCSNDWDQMTGNDQLRFCTHCEKNVNDLSQLTRAQAIRLVRRSNGKLCLRIHRDALGQIITRDVSEKLYSISRRTSRLAAGAFGTIVGLTGAAYAQSTPAIPEPANVPPFSHIKRDVQPSSDGNSWITGTVMDQNGAVIPGATVSILNEATGENLNVTSADNGGFRQSVTPGSYTITAALTPFDTRVVSHVAVDLGAETKNDLTLTYSGPSAVVGGGGMIEYETPILKAAQADDDKEVRRLIRSGADVNQREDDGVTALELAVSHGNLKMAERLLKAGAKVDLHPDNGQNAMFWLSSDSDMAMIQLLQRAGSNIDQCDTDGNTPLIVEAAYSDVKLIDAMIAAGANVNAINDDSYTALMIAAEQGNTDAVKSLLAAGAIYSFRSKEGKDALQLARENGRTEIGELLIAAGAVDSYVEPDIPEPVPPDEERPEQ